MLDRKMIIILEDIYDIKHKNKNPGRKQEEKEKHDPVVALLANRFGFIKIIIQRWKIDG
jgi:hypothetical protein